jgi:aminoglycoside phosphotransferase (APT) family kinase protein
MCRSLTAPSEPLEIATVGCKQLVGRHAGAPDTALMSMKDERGGAQVFAGADPFPDRAGGIGIDIERVTYWLTANVPQLTAPFEFEVITGGRSNLTFRSRDGHGRRFVLRRPPFGDTLRTAHDMGREYRILVALAGSDVPVPRAFGFCEDPAVTDAPFYVMELVEGYVLREPADVVDTFDVSTRSALTRSLVDVLVSIHCTDPSAVGLGDLGQKEGYIDRQLRRWWRQYELVRTRALPVIEDVHRRLVRALPVQQRPAIVHGDYRLDNVIFGRDARVAAVLDWELCTLGDPLADLGGLMVSWVEADEQGRHMLGRTPTRLLGFPSRSEVIDRYAQGTGLDVSNVAYYVAFAYWRLACIGEGVYARFRDGKMGPSADVGPELLGDQVLMLADLALDAISNP